MRHETNVPKMNQTTVQRCKFLFRHNVVCAATISTRILKYYRNREWIQICVCVCLHGSKRTIRLRSCVIVTLRCKKCNNVLNLVFMSKTILTAFDDICNTSFVKTWKKKPAHTIIHTRHNEQTRHTRVCYELINLLSCPRKLCLGIIEGANWIWLNSENSCKIG